VYSSQGLKGDDGYGHGPKHTVTDAQVKRYGLSAQEEVYSLGRMALDYDKHLKGRGDS